VGTNFLVQILQKVTDGYMKKIESIQKQKEEVPFLSIHWPFVNQDFLFAGPMFPAESR